MEFDNTNRGSIWKNDKKETERHPDFTGTLNVEGTEYWVSAWKRKPDASVKAPALSFSIKAKEGLANLAKLKTPPVNEPEFDDNLPF